MKSNEECRERIIELVNQMHNNLWLNRIFLVVQHMYLNELRGKSNKRSAGKKGVKSSRCH